jgi:lysozyme family protein
MPFKTPSWALSLAKALRPTARAPVPAPSRFLACLPYTLAQECPYPNDWSNPANFSDDPHDPGGATMCGITQNEYNAYRNSLHEPEQDVKQITQAEGQAIYLGNYWQPYCPQLPIGLDLSFFDSSVNMGGKQATEILQFALEIGVDGIWGPQTAGAVAGITDVGDIINAFTTQREAVYRSFPTFQYFGTDWIRRATEIGDESIQMTEIA